MIKEHERLADDTGEETNGSIDALTAALEIAEAAELEGFELGIWRNVSIQSW